MVSIMTSGCLFIVKQKTAYEMRISDWSSDVCSSDLYARDREAFGRPIGTMRGMRWMLAEMYRDIEVGRSILYRACASADPFPDPYLAAIAKMHVNEMRSEAPRAGNVSVSKFGSRWSC